MFPELVFDVLMQVIGLVLSCELRWIMSKRKAEMKTAEWQVFKEYPSLEKDY